MNVYKIKTNSQTGELLSLSRSDGWSIPFDPANTDYQEYLKWVAEGNSPYPADSATPEPAEGTE
jgi:hypothetical protein